MTDRWGIDESYVDASGNEQHIDPAVVERLRGIIGEVPEATSVLVRRPGCELPAGTIELEGGGELEVSGRLPEDVPLGYHRLTPQDDNPKRLIVSPGRCHLPDGLRAWGWAAQLYATRSRDSWGMGDLADLRRLAAWSRRAGAGFVLVNPLQAVPPTEGQQPSPYFPASRRFRNPLYLRVEEVPGAEGAAAEVERGAKAGRALNEDRLIDRDAVWALKLEALQSIWAARPRQDEFRRWLDEAPSSLREFATWTVLAEELGPDWRTWSDEFRRPDGRQVAAFAEQHADRVRFHAWLQWLTERQLAAACDYLTVIQDLPIGVDPGGFDAWAWQDVLATGVAVGAPPDEFNTAGQNWGLPPFVPWRLAEAGYEPFVQIVRSGMASGGGLRVDHVMGLFRLWWIPGEGEDVRPSDGAYVRYPSKDLLDIVALESHRAGALVVGEDLGTVEKSAQEALAEHAILSYRLLWFEEEDPATWPPTAMAAVTTHDLPTVAGLWDGSDLQAQRDADLEPNVESTEKIRDRLAAGADLAADADSEDAVVGAHQLLSRAPCVLLSATLDDALAEPERPNIPGGDGARPNWSLALPQPLEVLEESPLAEQIAAILREAVGADPPADGR